MDGSIGGMNLMKKINKNEPLGVDLVNDMPDYTKNKEENEEIYRERYKKAYGKYPEENKED